MAKRYFHVNECQRAVLRGDELLALHLEEQVKHLLIKHFPRPNLLLDHVVSGLFDVHVMSRLRHNAQILALFCLEIGGGQRRTGSRKQELARECRFWRIPSDYSP